MSNKLGIFVLSLLLAGLLAPVSTVFATQKSGHDREKHSHRHSEAYWEKYVTREVGKYQEEHDALYARLERERIRGEKQLAKSRHDLCRTLSRLEQKLNIDLSLPSFCSPGVPSVPSLTLSALPSSVIVGASSTVQWVSTNTTFCIASDGWSGVKMASGTQSVAPSATTTYALTCGGAGGTTTKSVTVGVTVTPLPVPLPTVDLSVTSSSILEGASTTLTWTSTNATSCVARNGWSGVRATTGAESIAPLATTTYVLECTNATGTSSDAVTVSVGTSSGPTPTPLPTVDLTASPLSVFVGGTSTLSWNTTNATHCVASGAGDWTGVKATTSSGIVTVLATTTYTIACGNATGTTTDSVEVTAMPVLVPVLGKVVLSEVMYDLGTGQGAEPANEWVELYNGTGAAVDVAGWKLKDSSATSTIATTSPLMVPAGGYVVVAASSTTAGMWGLSPSSVVLVTGKQLGNSLGNTSDSLQLLNPANTVIDAVSWGGDMGAFDSTGLSAPAGSSIARVPVSTDSDTKADWVVLATPTPGS
jgi:hypothetical protein